MGKLSIVTDSNDSGKLRINVSDKKICYWDEVEGRDIILVEGLPKYRPMHCSELNKRMKGRNWNKPETLFISGDRDNPILKYRKYSWELNSDNKPVGEIDIIDVDNTNPSLSFPITGEIDERTAMLISDKYYEIFDTNTDANEEICFLRSSKNTLDTSEYQVPVDLIKGYDSYTNSVNICELIEYSSYPRTTGRVDLSIKYSKINLDTNIATVYNYSTIFKAFEYDNNRELSIENTVEIISDGNEDLIRIEYFGGTIRLFPVSDKISECIINECTVIYGNFR